MNGIETELPAEIIMAIVCERMGWTIYQFHDQPYWFIKTLLLKWNQEGKYETEQAEKNNGK